MSYRVPLIALALVTTTASCVSIPLGDPETSKVRKEYVGLWLFGDEALYDIQQFDKRTYLIDWMKYDSLNGKIIERHLVKGWITEIKGTQFVTLQVLRVDAANNPARKGDTVTLGKIELKDKQLHLSVFTRIVGKKVSTPDQLRKYLEKNHANGSLYSSSLMKFERVTKSDKRAAVILKAFGRNQD